MFLFYKLNFSQQQAKLRISLQNSQVKTMKRMETVTISEFLAICGGILGLFMGFSALSVIELVYYPTLRLFWMIQRMKTENDKAESNERANTESTIDIENRTVSNGKFYKINKNLILIYV